MDEDDVDELLPSYDADGTITQEEDPSPAPAVLCCPGLGWLFGAYRKVAAAAEQGPKGGDVH